MYNRQYMLAALIVVLRKNGGKPFGNGDCL